MRLNKKKLAALAMSAVMAASTMPFPVMAEELSAGDAAAFEVEAVGDATVVEVSKVTIDKTGKVTVTYSDGSKDDTTYTATIVEKAATCTEAKKYVGTVTIKGKDYKETIEEEGTALGHDLGEKKLIVDTYPTCDTPGVGHYVKYCSRCDHSEPVETGVAIAATGHKDGETKVTYAAGTNTTVTEDGKAELIDKTIDGTYYKITKTYCSVCGDEITSKTKTETLTVSATDVRVTTKKVEIDTEKGNIKSAINGVDPSTVKDEKLKLKDCTKDGFYWIVSLDKNGVEISRVKHTVAAHHVTEVSYNAKDSTKKGMLKYIKDKDDNIIGVESKSCKESVEYYEIVTCTAEGTDGKGKEISRTLKVAEPTGDHVLSADTETQLKYVADKAEKKVVLTSDYINRLKANKEIKVEIKDACEAEGTVTVTAYCNVCGKEVQSVTAKVEKLGHDFGDAKDIVEENKVDSTCSKEGSYDTVHYCKVCGKREVVRTGIIIPKKAHSYVDEKDAFIRFTGNKVVDLYEDCTVKGEYFHTEDHLYGFGVNADLAITCETCGETASLRTLTMKVVDVQKETSAHAGYVTLKATATKQLKDNKTEKIEKEYTVPYYTSMAAYLDRNPGKDAVNGLHEDNDHVFRYYVNSEFQADYAGIVEYNGGEFFVADGVLCSGANGLNEFGGKWYFLANGQIQRGYNGLALYDGEWFYLKNGELDATVKGLVDYDGGRFLFADGRLVKEHNGLWQDFDGTWYFLALGQVQDQFTGTTVYDGQTFKLENGKLVA